MTAVCQWRSDKQPDRQSHLAIESPTPLKAQKYLTRCAESQARQGLKVQLKSQQFLIVFHTLSLLWLSGKVDAQMVYLSTSYPRRGTFIMVYKKIGVVCSDAVTFCQGKWSAPGESVAWDAASISWRVKAALWNCMCGPRLTWMEYDKTLKRGSESAWETCSRVFWPRTFLENCSIDDKRLEEEFIIKSCLVNQWYRAHSHGTDRTNIQHMSMLWTHLPLWTS